jgi:hypothetical protein
MPLERAVTQPQRDQKTLTQDALDTVWECTTHSFTLPCRQYTISLLLVTTLSSISAAESEIFNGRLWASQTHLGNNQKKQSIWATNYQARALRPLISLPPTSTTTIRSQSPLIREGSPSRELSQSTEVAVNSTENASRATSCYQLRHRTYNSRPGRYRSREEQYTEYSQR